MGTDRLAELRAQADRGAPARWQDVLALLAEIAELRQQLDTAERQTKELEDRYIGKEPTIREEMAYLNRCLTAVHEACTAAERQAARWEYPLPVPEWVATVRAAAGGEHPIEDEVAALKATLAERDAQIAGLLHALDTDTSDDQAGVPT